MTYPCHWFSEQVGLVGDLGSTNNVLIPLILRRFPAIVYNDALTSKSDFLNEPTEMDIREKDEKSSQNDQNRARNGKAWKRQSQSQLSKSKSTPTKSTVKIITNPFPPLSPVSLSLSLSPSNTVHITPKPSQSLTPPHKHPKTPWQSKETPLAIQMEGCDHDLGHQEKFKGQDCFELSSHTTNTLLEALTEEAQDLEAFSINRTR
ncbi:hypothetical protein Tco_1291368 [Tanacetum coccineum]